MSVFNFFMGDSKKQDYSSFVFIGLKWDEKVNLSKALKVTQLSLPLDLEFLECETSKHEDVKLTKTSRHFVRKTNEKLSILLWIFLQGPQWTDHSTITLTMWNDQSYVDIDGIIQYTASTVSHGSVSTFWTLDKEPLPSFPFATVSKLCAALYVINVHEFFWVKISCTQTRSIFPKWKYICEKRTNGIKEELS